MKAIYQIFTLIVAAFIMVACSDSKQDMQADITAIEQVTEQSEVLQNIQQLQYQLAELDDSDIEQYKQIFTQVSAEYNKLKNAVSGLTLKTTKGKEVQSKFTNAMDKFITLMNQSVEYSGKELTPEQKTQYLQLQQESTKALLEANNALIEFKQKTK